MISRIRGTLVRRDAGLVEVMTAGGVCYEIEVPLTIYERLPRAGADIELRTMQIVREDAVTLYGFLDDLDRRVFARLLTASGVGPRLALNMLSTMPSQRIVRAILDRDIASLRQIPGLGAKKAERLAVELTDRLDDLAALSAAASPRARSTEEAVGALVALGYSHAAASAAVRRVLDSDGEATGITLIKAALSSLGG